MLAASDVHQHGALGIMANVRAQKMPSVSRSAQQADRDIGLMEKRLELIAAMENGNLRASRGERTHP